jgi:tRNA G18 (ribose-2'-O)-methylase SpoU
MFELRTRGYFGIGAEGISKSANVGALLRTGHAFGAAFCFTIGTGWDARASRAANTADTPLHVPMWRYLSPAEMSLPRGCALVGIELLPEAVELPSFRHPLNAAYVLGPERSGLSSDLLERCDHVVRVPAKFALNLAVAGALVLYDRLLQHGRFAERPVGSRGVTRALPPAGHGPPRFRKTIPDWLHAEAKKSLVRRACPASGSALLLRP